MIYALWHGGSSYSPGSTHDGDTETFESIAAARTAFQDRYRHGNRWKQHFAYVSKPADDVYTPTVDESSTMWLFFYDPTAEGVTDPYPDKILSFGPRGGIRMENA